MTRLKPKESTNSFVLKTIEAQPKNINKPISSITFREVLKQASLFILGMNIGIASGSQGGKGHEDFEFDPKLLAYGAPADLSQFSKGNAIVPGIYRVDVFLNQSRLGNTEIHMKRRTPESMAAPCLSDGLVDLIGLELPPSPKVQGAIAEAPEPTDTCRYWDQILDAGSADFDLSTQRLDISLPQAFLKKKASQAISESDLDDGITVGLISYQFNTYRSGRGKEATQSTYLGLNTGLNIGPWRFRSQGSWQYSSVGGLHYQKIGNNVSRDLFEIKSQLTVGQSYTDGQLLNSFGLEGARLSSAEQMLPESDRNNGPVIRSEARSNARVKVTQGGLVIYETVVPPGPFILSDLRPVGMGGNLNVLITEADGSERSFSVAYSSVGTMVRSGRWRYSVASGRVMNSNDPLYAGQAALQYGLNDDWTVNTAAVLSRSYASYLAGAGTVTPYGMLMVNALISRLQLKSTETLQASGLNFSWNKAFDATRTQVFLQGHHYNSSRFYAMQDAVNLLNRPTADRLSSARPRTLIQSNLSQQLSATSNLIISWTRTGYGSMRSPLTGFQLAYTARTILGVFSLNAGREYSGDPRWPVNNRFSIGLTLPLDTLAGSPTYGTALFQNNSQTGSSRQLGVSGGFGDDFKGNYSLSASDSNAGVQSSANLGYRTDITQIGVGLTSGPGQTQVSVSSTGGMLIHSGGLTLTPALGETLGLALVEGGQGSQVAGFPTGAADRNGYLVVPFLTPYAMNVVDLDLTHAPPDLELNETSQKTAPTTGAVVRLKFTQALGRSVMVKARLADGRHLPFGTPVTDEMGHRVGIVGQSGRLLAHLTQNAGTLIVAWEAPQAQACQITYALPPDSQAAMLQLDATCQPIHRDGASP